MAEVETSRDGAVLTITLNRPDVLNALNAATHEALAAALAARAAEVAEELASLPTRAIGMTKRLLDRAPTATLEDQLEWEAQLQAVATRTEDFHEGVAAFLEKRPPSFQGR